MIGWIRVTCRSVLLATFVPVLSALLVGPVYHDPQMLELEALYGADARFLDGVARELRWRSKLSRSRGLHRRP